MYFIHKFGGLNPTQNMFKMFPQISGIKNIAFSKADSSILQSPSSMLYLIYTDGYVF